MAAATSAGPITAPARSSASTKAISASILGCSVRALSIGVPGAQAMLVEQHAEVGPVDAELRLHGRVGQPDLPADDAGARRDLVRDPGGLHGVGGVDVPGGQQAAHRGTGLPGGARGDEHVQRLQPRRRRASR